MLKLILVRHGQTDYNAQFRYQGQSDIPLNEVGLAQAEKLRMRLSDFQFDMAYCSDLQRARRTAEIILRDHSSGLEATSTPLLREVNGGGFEGLTWSEISDRYPEISRQWSEDRAAISPPDGESLNHAVERIIRFLEQFKTIPPSEERTVLIATHGGVIGVLLCYLMGMDLNRIWQWRTDTCSITIVSLYEKGAILSLYNDINHLGQPTADEVHK